MGIIILTICERGAIQNVKGNLQSQNKALPKVNQPLPTDYHPELDISSPLNDEDTNLYQSYRTILRWIVKLGRLDIYVHVAFLSSHLTHPRIGYLEATYQFWLFKMLREVNHGI
jgi:hypothetical protein